MLNFLLFLLLFFILGLFIRDSSFLQNFVSLTIMGQSLNAFDLLVIDLLWWRNTKRIRFTKIPEKELYRNPKKHIWSFIRGVAMYLGAERVIVSPRRHGGCLSCRVCRIRYSWRGDGGRPAHRARHSLWRGVFAVCRSSGDIRKYVLRFFL